MEEWRFIPGYEGRYEISSYGRVRSWLQGNDPSYRKLSADKGGYLRIHLLRDGKLKSFLVHRLVMSVFVGASQLPVNHIDGNKQNNHLPNLEYCTAKENMHHSEMVLGNRMGARGARENNGRAKLTELQVAELRRLAADGTKSHTLAGRFQISVSQVDRIKRGTAW